MNRSWLQITRPLAALLRSWWQIDRVRISPREGALLRLQPPCWLMIGDLRVEIMTRRETAAEEPAVIYHCRTDRGPATLSVKPMDQGRSTAVHWQTAEGDYRLSPADIEVYA